MESVSQHSREVAKGTFWGLTGNISFNLISFLYTLFIARMVSQDDLGLFFLTMSVVSLGSVLDNLGVSTAIARYIPFFEGRKEKEKIKALLNISYSVVAISAIVFLSALWLLSDAIGDIYQNPRLTDTVRFLSFYLLLSNLFNLNLSFLRSRTDMRAMQISTNTQNFLKLSITVLFFLLFEPSVEYLIAAYLLSFLFSFLLSIIYVRRNLKDIPPASEAFPLDYFFFEIFPFGIAMTMIYSISAIFTSSNRLLLGYLVDPALSTQTVAIFSVAAALSTVLLTFPHSIGDIFLPIMSRLFGKNDIGKMKSVTETAQRWSLFITVPFGVVMILFSTDIISLVYGESYASGGLVMSILILGLILRLISYMISLVLAAMRLVKVQMKIVLASGIVSLILNVLLIPLFGMVGAAVASFVGYIVSIMMLSHFAWKRFGFRIPIGVYKLLLAGGIAAALIWGLGSAVPFSSLAGDLLADILVYKLLNILYLGAMTGISILLFVVFALLLKCLEMEDILLMNDILRKIRLPDGVIELLGRIARHGVSKG